MRNLLRRFTFFNKKNRTKEALLKLANDKWKTTKNDRKEFTAYWKVLTLHETVLYKQ